MIMPNQTTSLVFSIFLNVMTTAVVAGFVAYDQRSECGLSSENFVIS